MTDGLPTTEVTAATEDERDLRARAMKRLEDKRGLMAHCLAYVSVHVLLVAIWYVTGAGFFWPVFPIFGWGIGLAFHAWAVIWPEPGEEQVRAEMDRLRGRRT